MVEMESGGRRRRAANALLAAFAIVWVPSTVMADQGGISFWLPGLFGSLAAVPGQPGLSFCDPLCPLLCLGRRQ